MKTDLSGPASAGNEAQQEQDALLGAVQAAVTIARNERITSVDALKKAMVDRGYSDELTGNAISLWADHVKDRGVVNLPSARD